MGRKGLLISNIPPGYDREAAFAKYLRGFNINVAQFTSKFGDSHAELRFTSKGEAAQVKSKLENAVCGGFHLNVEFENARKRPIDIMTLYLQGFSKKQIPRLSDHIKKFYGGDTRILYNKQQLYAILYFSTQDQSNGALVYLKRLPHYVAHPYLSYAKRLNTNTRNTIHNNTKNSTPTPTAMPGIVLPLKDPSTPTIPQTTTVFTPQSISPLIHSTPITSAIPVSIDSPTTTKPKTVENCFPIYLSGLPNRVSSADSINFLVSAVAEGVVHCSYMPDKRHGFASFATLEQAANAINQLHGAMVDGSTLEAHFKLQTVYELQTFTLRVNNLAPTIDDDLLYKIFALAVRENEIIAAHVVSDFDGISERFGFVEFINQETASAVCQKMNGRKFMDYELELSTVSMDEVTLLLVVHLPLEYGTKELKKLIQQYWEYYSCFVPQKGVGIVMVDKYDSGVQLLQDLENVKILGRSLQGVICNAQYDKNHTTSLQSNNDIETQELELLEQIQQIENQIKLVNTKDELEERLKFKRERQQQEEKLRKELEEYKDQLQLAKLEKEIEEYKVQKELQEREMEILASIDTLMAQKELHQMQENIRQFEDEIQERNNIKQGILALQAKKKAYDIELECSPPEWFSDQGWDVKEPAILYTFKLGKDRLETESHKNVTVQIAPKPFARGSFRLAFWMKVWKDKTYEQFVAKQPILANEEQDMTSCKQDVFTQLYATEMARLFSANNLPKRVEYVPIYMICFSTRPQKSYMTIEKVLDGEWKRYSNNKGFVHTSESADILHAFSHFSYVHSGEPKKIVVDIQGVKQANSYVLTDPSVHCEESRIFGDSNLGQEGIDEFFKTHSCNPICKLLKLPVHPSAVF